MYRLIIIDDEEKIVEGMGMLFPWKTIGFSVEGLFTSAVEALEFMENNQVDVVLSDIEMPDMDGIELSRRLLEKEDVKVVLFSSKPKMIKHATVSQIGAGRPNQLA